MEFLLRKPRTAEATGNESTPDLPEVSQQTETERVTVEVKVRIVSLPFFAEP